MAAAAVGQESVVFPGEEGALSHIAAQQYFKNVQGLTMTPTVGIAACFRAVGLGRALYAVVPIENSSSGTLVATYDLLLEHDVIICGELGVPEVYCLCGKVGTTESKVRKVLSHPNILEACSTFISTRLSGAMGAAVDRTATVSTTEAASTVAAGGEENAAICTRESAVARGLEVIAEGVGNDSHMETRYVVIKRRQTPGDAPFPEHVPGHIRKSSAVFVLKNESAAIFKLLSCWALRNINIHKMETRPVPSGGVQGLQLPTASSSLWCYFFYVDWEIPNMQTTESADRLWDCCKEFSLWQRDLGTYQSHVTRTEKNRAVTWDERVDMMAKA